MTRAPRISSVFDSAPAPATFDVARIREDFPILREQVHGWPLVYLDNAATAQKPIQVIDALHRYYTSENANIHRGVYYLSEQATEHHDQARAKVRDFINAASEREIIFVRGATEGINLVANCFGRAFLHEGDEILVTAMEHHANIVPWQMACEQTGAKLRVVPMNDEGELLMDEFARVFNDRTKLVSIVHISNALGTINPVEKIIRKAHSENVPVLVDGAQAAPHYRLDMQALDADFYAFSGHKLFGPTGIGILYGKADWLERLPPYQGGGDMISSVSFERTLYNDLPCKFEAGTPHIAGAIGLGAAIDYVEQIGLSRIGAYERSLLTYATQELSDIEGLRIIGKAREKAGVISFVLDGVHAHDVGSILDHYGIAIRAGQHCAQPVMDRFGVPATARASFAFYNTREEVDSLVRAIRKVKEVFR